MSDELNSWIINNVINNIDKQINYKILLMS